MSATWNELLTEAMDKWPDDPLLAKAPDDEAIWNRKFDDGYGTAVGPAVLAWTRARVYFPVTYDGAEWMASAPRNPQNEGQEHVGGQ